MQVQVSDEHGFMLGFLPDASYHTRYFDLRPGDCMLVFTDGVSEAEDMKGNFVDRRRTVCRGMNSIPNPSAAPADAW
jgi:serine phosphatase RsbU (regulator of sigma subunit)